MKGGERKKLILSGITMRKRNQKPSGLNVAVEDNVVSLIKRIYFKGKCGTLTSINSKTRLIQDLGFDSVEILELIVQIEEAFGIDVPDQFFRTEMFETTGAVIDMTKKLLKKNGQKA